MSINFPNSRKEVDNRAKADVKSQLPTSNPWLKNSFLGALITGYSGRIYEAYLQMKNALLEMFPDTASGAYIDRWGSYVAITRNSSSVAGGDVIFTGTLGTVIPAGTTVSASNGLTYTTNLAATITTNTSTISSLTRSGTTATADTVSAHNLATGMTVTIAGATPSGYNGAVVITVVDADTFTYTVSSSLSTPPTGTITATVSSINVAVTSTAYGKASNQVAGTQLVLASPISGVNATVWVPVVEIASGTDIETDDQYRTRVLYRYQNPISLFNVSAIKSKAFETAGITRVWVSEAGTVTDPISVSSITRASSLVTVTTAAAHNLESGQYVTIAGANETDYNAQFKVIVISTTVFAFALNATPTSPATGTITAAPAIPNGQVKIWFARDRDTNPIPTAAATAALKTAILTIKPAHVASGDVFVNSPASVTQNFTFTALSPNTTEMRAAITANLQALFSDSTDISTPVLAYSYQSAIWQTVDETGALVKSFTLSTPSSTIAVTEGQLPILGTITYP